MVKGAQLLRKIPTFGETRVVDCKREPKHSVKSTVSVLFCQFQRKMCVYLSPSASFVQHLFESRCFPPISFSYEKRKLYNNYTTSRVIPHLF